MNQSPAKILICIGSGGVGKTSVAAAIGYKKAMEGQSVLVLTIDPSQRLKTTLKINDSGDATQIQIENCKGKLWACVVNPKRVFDDFIRRAASKDQKVEKLLQNKLYQQLSTSLSGSQEFTALEKLYEAWSSQLYDVIILDTPPAQHAIDFLNSPQKLSNLFQEQIASWLRSPEKKQGIIRSLFQAGTQQVLKSLEYLTGSDFIEQLKDFFESIKDWQQKLEDRTIQVQRLLTSPNTSFILITSLDHAKLAEALWLIKEIRKGGFNLSTVIINRYQPVWMNKNFQVPNTDFGQLYRKYLDFQIKREKLIENFNPEAKITKLPELAGDINELNGVAGLATFIE